MSSSKKPLVRENNGYLAVPERWALDWLLARTPAWLTPNTLTVVGLLGAVLCLAGYVLATKHGYWLWLVNCGLVVNWLGDSLDGRLARKLGTERPKFGFFLDQSVDIVGQFLVAVGLGLSGYLQFDIAVLGFAVYLMMIIHGLLRAHVTRVFALASAGIGLTEVRCFFFLANVAFFFWPPRPVVALGAFSLSYADLCGLVWIVAHLALFAVCTVLELKRLSRDDEAGR